MRMRVLLMSCMRMRRGPVAHSRKPAGQGQRSETLEVGDNRGSGERSRGFGRDLARVGSNYLER